jgi:hypothetical protein
MSCIWYDGLPSPSNSPWTDFLVRRIPHGRTRKSVVPPLPSNDFTKSNEPVSEGLLKSHLAYASGCESSLHCLQPNVTCCESLTYTQTELGS